MPVTIAPSPTAVPSLTATPTYTIHPVIHEQPGEIFQSIFSIPVNSESLIQYEMHPDSIQGPNGIAILLDNSFLLADPVSNRLLHYDQKGILLNFIDLGGLGVGYVSDLRVKGNEIFLLETSYQKYRVHLLDLNGSLISSEDIPYKFPIDTKNSVNTLEGGLTGIAVDCLGRIILEITGGSRLFPLSEVQRQPDPTNITQGLLCNNKRYFVSTSEQWTNPQVSAGDYTYQTKLTYGLGGLNFLDVFQNGNIYLVRNDVVNQQVIAVDKTIHFIDADNVILGTARIPLSEFYYPVMRSSAISPTGEVFVLLPRPNSVDVVRLNFYEELEPILPGAAKPQIILHPANP